MLMNKNGSRLRIKYMMKVDEYNEYWWQMSNDLVSNQYE